MSIDTTLDNPEIPEWTEEELAQDEDSQSPPRELDDLTTNKKNTRTDGGSGGGFFGLDDGSFMCDECEREFIESFLVKNFQCSVCDDCRDRDGKHSLITKTDAKNEYLLKDEDFDKRGPPLKCIVRKNPHNSNWGNMKLFLRIQVEERALQIWGTEEALEAEREKRQTRQTKSKKRTFDKMIKELRMNARSSLGTAIHANHVHDFGAEDYNEESDTYVKKCKTCEHVVEYEKM